MLYLHFVGTVSFSVALSWMCLYDLYLVTAFLSQVEAQKRPENIRTYRQGMMSLQKHTDRFSGSEEMVIFVLVHTQFLGKSYVLCLF